MTTSPQLTDDDVRRWTDEGSFRRGRRYFQEGHILNPRRRGSTLRARCMGSRPQPYHVAIELGPQGILAGACSCPVGAGGHCKHAVALLLTWLHEPESFTSVEELETSLEQRTKSELIILVRRMLDRYPDLERLLELPIVAGAEEPPPLDEAVIRRQAAGAFSWTAYDDWSAPYDIARELLDLVSIGDDYAATGQWRQAGTIYRIVMEETLDGYRMVHDEGGELHPVVDGCVKGLGQCLAATEDPAQRETTVEALFDVYRWDAAVSGIDMGYAARGVILAHCTAEEKERVAGWVRAAMPAGDGWGEGFLRQRYGAFLLSLEEERLDDEAYLRICRETGRREDLVDRLLALGRVDEAVAAARQAGDYTLLRLADVFASHYRDDLVEGLIRGRSPSERDKRLTVWLRERAQARGDLEETLHLTEALFWRDPDPHRYRELRGVAHSLGRWEALRGAILARLEADERHHLLIEIHLDEGEIDRALETLNQWQAASRWSRAEDRLSMRVARAAERERPRAAIRLYLEAVKALIAYRGRGNYAEAAIHLTRVRDLYRRLGEEAAWEALITGLREENPRLRALKDELKKAGL
jgi:uncharacterized Zn finger protein